MFKHQSFIINIKQNINHKTAVYLSDEGALR